MIPIIPTPKSCTCLEELTVTVKSAIYARDDDLCRKCTRFADDFKKLQTVNLNLPKAE